MNDPIVEMRSELVRRRDAFNVAIAAFDAVIGLPVLPGVSAPIADQPRRKYAKRHGAGDESSAAKKGGSKRQPRAPRASDASHGEAILTALRRKNEQSPAELQKAVGAASLAALRYWMKPLVEQGQITVTGQTANRRVRLAGHRPAKEVP